jgi:gamma-glutamylcyclotransferase (GGCT)/AIG2-like uncharacterized protein YtfP
MTTDTKVNGDFAVYGTLRIGCGNDPHWWQLAEAQEGVFHIKGFRLLVPSHSAFPYAVPTGDQDDTVVVDLLHSPEKSRLSLIHKLDILEGHPRHYRRITTPVYDSFSSSHITTAWVYISAITEYLGECQEVPYGDWMVIEDRNKANRLKSGKGRK